MFKSRLKELRAKHGLTQEQLSAIIGVERSSVGKYEGKQSVIPSTDILNKIADYFDVSIDYLLGRTSEANIKNAPASYDTSANIPEPLLILAQKFERLSPSRQRDILKILEYLLDQQASQDIQ